MLHRSEIASRSPRIQHFLRLGTNFPLSIFKTSSQISPLSSHLLNITTVSFSVLGDAVSYVSRPKVPGSKPSWQFFRGIIQLLGPKRASFLGHFWHGRILGSMTVDASGIITLENLENKNSAAVKTKMKTTTIIGWTCPHKKGNS